VGRVMGGDADAGPRVAFVVLSDRIGSCCL